MGEVMHTDSAPLLTYIERSKYPTIAGYKRTGTSSEAAHKVEASGRAEVLRNRVLYALRRAQTAKEVAELLGEEITSIRPRISELKERNLVEETGERSKGQNIYIAIG